PAPGPPRSSPPRRDGPQPSHRPRKSAPVLPSAASKHLSSLRENHQRPNEAVLTPKGGHDIPPAINSPGHRQGHGLSSGLKTRENQVLTCRRPPHPESARRRAP